MIVELRVREEVFLRPGREDDMRIRSACVWTVWCLHRIWYKEWLYDVAPDVRMHLVGYKSGSAAL